MKGPERQPGQPEKGPALEAAAGTLGAFDPSLANERATRCYERVGFKRVGVLRRYWRGPDGGWQDGLLLDLLADELVGAE